MPAPSEQLVLKEGDVFLLTDQTGDVVGNAGYGLYYHDTRYLSLYSFKVNGNSPSLLNFSSSQNFMGTFQFANDLFHLSDGTVVLPQTISIRRSRFISDGLHERIGFVNYNRFPVPLTVTLEFGSDFRDIFDVRGFPRETWGEILEPEVREGSLVLRYKGLDNLTRVTEVGFDRPPDSIEVQAPEQTSPLIEPDVMVPVVGAPTFHITIFPPRAVVTWNLMLEQNQPVFVSVHAIPQHEDDPSGGLPDHPDDVLQAVQYEVQAPTVQPNGRYDRAVNHMRFSYWTWDSLSSHYWTDNEEFTALLQRSQHDLRVLSSVLGDGYFPSAGIPWYACPFGRDSLITALQTLTLNPQIAVGTLRVLAQHQGTKEDSWREEQPGKILHEMRRGEMARLGMVPHSPYFGTVDATPLFVMLFAETMCWLNDDALFDELMPNVRSAVEWIDRYADVDGDGFYEYVASTSHTGIRNQVWKDSGDSIQFPDGTLAETPIAAVEVQGYVYAAKRGLGEILRGRGMLDEAEKLDNEAEELKKRFNEAFWMPEEGFYTQGLDRDKRKVPAITTNPGHALWSGIADEDKAIATARRLLESDMLSGWGLRTLSEGYPSYNPMSYHNGSVWPHDNSIVMAGFRRYGCDHEAQQVITQIFEASRFFRYARLPELYCGFKRDVTYQSGPAEYPVSCSPQAWAAGATLLFAQAMLGLEADARQERIRIRPSLPDWLSIVRVRNLRVGNKRVELIIEKRDGRHDVAVTGGDTGVALEIS